MNRNEFSHVLRAMYNISDETDFIFAGSQAILGHYHQDQLPEQITMSAEIDVFSLNILEDDPKFNSISLHLGQDSQFHKEFGYYVDVIGEKTPILPRSWKSNLALYTTLHDNKVLTGHCLSIVDICVSKLMAKRPHDTSFASILLESKIISPVELLAGLHDVEIEETYIYDGEKILIKQERALQWLIAHNKSRGREN